MSIAVSLANLAVLVVYQMLNLVVDSNLATRSLRFCLGFEDLAGFVCTFANIAPVARRLTISSVDVLTAHNG